MSNTRIKVNPLIPLAGATLGALVGKTASGRALLGLAGAAGSYVVAYHAVNYQAARLEAASEPTHV